MIGAIFKYLPGHYTPFLLPFWDEEEPAIVRNWLSGRMSRAKVCEELLAVLRGTFGTGGTLTFFNSGRAALQSALEGFRFPDGSEVVMPTFCCGSVPQAVHQAGLVPVFADIDNDFNLRLDSVAECLTPRVKAVILPHLSGTWAKDTASILSWAQSRGIAVIEDCAQAFGLAKNGCLAGTSADVSIFSSGLGKPLFGPGGGWLFSRNPAVSAYAAKLDLPDEPELGVQRRLCGFLREYRAPLHVRGTRNLYRALKHRFTGGRYRAPAAPQPFSRHPISAIEAALAAAQARKIGVIVSGRQKHADIWRQRLSALHLTSLRLPEADTSIHTKMLLSFSGDDGDAEAKRVRAVLRRSGIEIEASYMPLHLRSSFISFRRSSMTRCDAIRRHVFSVPVRPNLNSEERQRISDALNRLK